MKFLILVIASFVIMGLRYIDLQHRSYEYLVPYIYRDHAGYSGTGVMQLTTEYRVDSIERVNGMQEFMTDHSEFKSIAASNFILIRWYRRSWIRNPSYADAMLEAREGEE